MHVLIIHQAFASLDEPGGTRHDEFARWLAAHGHRVTIIASPVSYLTGALLRLPSFSTKMGGEQEGGNVTIIRAQVYGAHHKSFLHRVLAFISFMLSSFWIGLRVKDVDIVWGTSPPLFQGISAWAIARLRRVPFIFEVRDLWPKFAVAIGVLKSGLLIWLAQAAERFLYRSADCVIVNSPGFIAHVQARGVRRIELIPNGADPAMFSASDEGAALRRVHNLADKFVVMYAGALGVSNDLEVVLMSAARLADKLEIMFVLLGDGKEKPALQKLAADLGLENLIFVSPVPKSEMANALAAADVCVAILKPLEEYKLTYPNKVFDYMAAAKPIALAIDGVIRAVVEAARCGYFVEPGNAEALADAIVKMCENRTQTREMGLRGRKYLEEHFAREKLAEKLLDLLQEMNHH